MVTEKQLTLDGVPHDGWVVEEFLRATRQEIRKEKRRYNIEEDAEELEVVFE